MKLIISLFFYFLISCENVSKNDVVNQIKIQKIKIKEKIKTKFAKIIEQRKT